MTDNDTIRKRIAALRRKVASAGASEAEAMAAAEMAARLMAEAGLGDDDVDFDEAQAELKTKGRGARDSLWGAVGRCTNCAPILITDWDPVVLFIGRAPGPDIAVYLVDVLNRAVDHEIEAFKRAPEFQSRRKLSTRRRAVQDFTLGLVVRLRVRLMELFAESISAEAHDAARALRDRRFADSHPLVPPARKVSNDRVAALGYAAGGRVQLAHGVNGGRAIERIGRA